jgi:DNA-binding protein HU-beta
MKMATLTVLSGVTIALMSFNAAAMTQGEMEDGWVEKYGGTKASAHDKFQAWENTLKSELAAKRAVSVSGIGTYRPQELSGKQRTTHLGGKTYTTDSYAMVKKPVVTTDSEFKAKMVAAGKMTDAEAAQMGAYYKTAIATTLKKGNSVQESGLGTYSVSKRAARIGTNSQGDSIRIPAHRVVKFNDGYGAHTRLKVDKDLTASLN